MSALLVLLPFLALAAPPGDPVAGREKADTERCLECHGSTGDGQGFSTGSDGKFARLGGQQYDYIVKQIQDFRSGQRKHEFMKMMATGISDADLADIAAYFAALPAMPAGAAPKNTTAQQLYQHGDAARQLPACTSCHGDSGKGIAGVAPVIGGQGKAYLEQQLQDWRSGSRNNSAGGVMNQFAKPLSTTEIEALARYVSEM
ncbi:cytochrome c oxidase, cbb3-type, subunit III [Duganella sacchari]|uniref:Cytochrome c oxidase, cbb3-type, subunit III n=1 Tax=Duganella sacchari TaxID=551987 RepID=A0A1M7TA98_9BURK|nr:c-type cytochrome [Duganella sacchari]SHN67649.1 cytochrome c oxidase, cbb3-type, subunit III [Duganella sacchari]